MRKNQEELIASIVNDPENDELRRSLSSALRGDDDSLAEFISLQLSRAEINRQTNRFQRPSGTEAALFERHAKRWAGELAEHVVDYEFHRGLVAKIVIDPQKFLAQGTKILASFPIRHVGFDLSESGHFPLRPLLQSGLFSNLDSIGFTGQRLTDSDLQEIAESPDLRSCLYLGLGDNSIGFRSFEAIAESPHMRNVLCIERMGGDDPEYHPGQRLQPIAPEKEDPWTSNPWIWAPLGEDGVALEREFGYIPWLHPQDNACDKFDARWFVNQGILPKRPFGSPVEH